MIKNIVNIARNMNIVPALRIQPTIKSTKLFAQPISNKPVKGFKQNNFNRKILKNEESDVFVKTNKETINVNTEKEEKAIRTPWQRADKEKIAEYFDNTEMSEKEYNKVLEQELKNKKQAWQESIAKEFEEEIVKEDIEEFYKEFVQKRPYHRTLTREERYRDELGYYAFKDSLKPSLEDWDRTVHLQKMNNKKVD